MKTLKLTPQDVVSRNLGLGIKHPTHQLFKIKPFDLMTNTEDEIKLCQIDEGNASNSQLSKSPTKSSLGSCMRGPKKITAFESKSSIEMIRPKKNIKLRIKCVDVNKTKVKSTSKGPGQRARDASQSLS